MPLNSHNGEHEKTATSQKLFSCWGRSRLAGKLFDQEATRNLDHGEKKEGSLKSPPLRAWHGWRLILLDSWFNILIFLVPAAGILKATTNESETLIFVACLLAMIPLVKLHDLATGVLSRRIGGNKTGLLNASLSNVVELVIAIAALRKCELRVVQSSLIGAMLSKLLLILGMCFFAGGTRFSEQGFDSTATQIHSSLLSISVGAVLLPAAFHFSLSYGSHDAVDAGASLEDQKRDILKMSHGVSVVLLFIYASYLIFQLWSHTHLYQDNTEPSVKLPVAASIRSATARVREKSSSIYERISQARSLEHIRSGSLQNVRTFGRKVPPSGLRTPTPETISPLEEMPETSLDLENSHVSSRPDPTSQRHHSEGLSQRGPYGIHPIQSPSRSTSPFVSTSQVTLANPSQNPITLAVDSTVRLVSDQERFIIRRDGSDSGSSGASDSRSSSRLGLGVDPFDSDEDRRWHGRLSKERARTRTPISDVLSAYYQESVEDGGLERTPRTNGHEGSESELQGSGTDGRNTSLGQYSSQGTQALENSEEMSWTLTLLLLAVVTVLVALNAEWLVDSMDHLSPDISKEWIGLILLPTVSAVAECITAVNVSVKDQLSLSISVAVGSTIQTALFVIPSMVILGWILDKPLALLFDPFESVVLYISVHTMSYVVADGKSNWLEGMILICLYIVIAVTFWFYPGSNFSTNLAVCTTSPPIHIAL